MLIDQMTYYKNNKSKLKKTKTENLLLAFIQRYSIIGIVYSD